MVDYKEECIKFVEHIKQHKKVQEAPINRGEVMCKLCNRTFNEIVKKDDWNLSDELKKWFTNTVISATAYDNLKHILRKHNGKVKEDIEADEYYKERPATKNDFIMKINKRSGDL